MALSAKRQQEIIELATPGVPLGTPFEINDDKILEPLIRAADRRRNRWLDTATDREELHFFAANWRWDGGGGKPLQRLIANPVCDAGTMLMIYWLACAEDYYFQYRTVGGIDWEYDREIFRLLLQIERRIVKGDYATAKIPFDPTPHISMRDRRDEFERVLPEIMMQPIVGKSSPRKKK